MFNAIFRLVLGVIVSSRSCDNPKPLNTLKRCEGHETKLTPCDDTPLCPKRTSTNEYATKQCAIFSDIVPIVDSKGPGIQAVFSNSNCSYSVRGIYIKGFFVLFQFVLGNLVRFIASEMMQTLITHPAWN